MKKKIFKDSKKSDYLKENNWNQEQGKAGELLARRYLEKRGFQILAARYSTRFGEIDLIGLRRETIYFIEVKTRSYDGHGDPLEAITPFKISRLKRAACLFLQENSKYGKEYDIELLAIAVRDFEEKYEIECVPIFPD